MELIITILALLLCIICTAILGINLMIKESVNNSIALFLLSVLVFFFLVLN